MVGDVGPAHGRALLGRYGLPRSESGPGVRGCHSHHHHCRGLGRRYPPQGPPGREHHHPEHRCLLGHDCGRRHLHAARTLHSATQIPRTDGELHAGVPLVAAGRHTGHSVSHPLPQVFRKGHARAVPLPRGHGFNAGAAVGREERRPGQTAAGGRTAGRPLRLCGGHLRSVDGELHLALL